MFGGGVPERVSGSIGGSSMRPGSIKKTQLCSARLRFLTTVSVLTICCMAQPAAAQDAAPPAEITATAPKMKNPAKATRTAPAPDVSVSATYEESDGGKVAEGSVALGYRNDTVMNVGPFVR